MISNYFSQSTRHLSPSFDILFRNYLVWKLTHRSHVFSYIGSLHRCPNGFTLAAWIRISLLETNSRYFFSGGGQTAVSHGVAVFTKNRKLQAVFRMSRKLWNVQIVDGRVDVWYHVVITWDSSNARIYKNGCLADTAGGTATTTTENSVYNDIFLYLCILWHCRILNYMLSKLWDEPKKALKQCIRSKLL